MGVVFVLSTRLCRDPDLGVTLVPNKAGAGVAWLSAADCPFPPPGEVSRPATLDLDLCVRRDDGVE